MQDSAISTHRRAAMFDLNQRLMFLTTIQQPALPEKPF
jgi:hypothetical protein